MRTVLLAALAVLLLAPGAAACANVAPLLDMQFPDKQKCKAPDHSDCAAVPTQDKAFEMDGTLVWSWNLDNCEAANLALSTDDIVVTFPPFPRNPSWLKLTVEPAEIHITFQDQWDVTDDQIDPATQKFVIREEFPIHVKIERVGDPTDDEYAKLDNKLGIVEEYAKAVSSQTSGFQPGFAFENFRFDATSLLESHSNSSNGTPAPSFGLLVLALAGLVARRR